MSELIAIQDQQFDMLGDKCVTEFRGLADPMTVCSMTSIAKRAGLNPYAFLSASISATGSSASKCKAC